MDKIILTPTGENWLTNGKTFSKKVYIGATGNPADWYEISNEEKERIEAEREEEADE